VLKISEKEKEFGKEFFHSFEKKRKSLSFPEVKNK
jgi:hypothetical protein